MKSKFTYSILQYRHSFLIREAVNVGILFAFHEENKIEFAFSNAHRVKLIYPDFNPLLFNGTLNFIQDKIKSESDNYLFKEFNINENFKDFLHNKLLREDSSVLQFTEPIQAITINDIKVTVKNYSVLLLPGIDTKKQEILKHNENYISKEYSKYLSQINKLAENKIKKDIPVSFNGINLKFDYSWKNGTLNLVKPLSFDLTAHADIQNKSATYFGYFTLLKNYAEQNNCRFDILVAKPQDRKLYDEYYKAIDNLNKIEAPKRIIKDTELKSYSEETIENLLKYN